jgi:type I restriction enzyme M protein
MELSPSEIRLVRVIENLDPEHDTVRVDADSGVVDYSHRIHAISHTRLLTPEELVRAYLTLRVSHDLAYPPEVLEIERITKVGRATKIGSLRNDLLLGKRGDPFILFESKSEQEYEKEMDSSIETQLFNAAAVLDPKSQSLRYLVYYTVYVPEDGLPLEKLITIDYPKHRTWADWVDAGRPNLMAIPKDYGLVRKPVFVRGGAPDLRRDATADEFDRIQSDMHDILWAGGKYQTELFFNLMSIFLAKIYDEKETDHGQPYEFQIFYEDGDPESPERVYARVNNLYKLALRRYLGQSDEDTAKAPDIAFDPPKVKYVVEVIQGISLTANRYDLLGLFFERIVRAEFKQSKGQYLTHTNIVAFVLRALGIDLLALDLINTDLRLPYVIDPACGSGTFLIETMKLITSTVLSNPTQLRTSQSVREFLADMFPGIRPNRWANDYIYGIEIHRDLATATKVNMVGHGDGSANIEAKDALLPFGQYSKPLLQVNRQSTVYSKPVNEQFDVVVSNPPFSIRADRDTVKGLPSTFAWGVKIAQALQKQEKKTEVDIENIFIERWYQLLRPRGRLGVVLPESIFDTTENRYVRLFLYRYFHIKAIVSLPYLAFKPYTATKTSLLFAQKKTDDEVRDYDRRYAHFEQEYDRLRRDLDKLAGRKTLNAAQFAELLRQFIGQPLPAAADDPDHLITIHRDAKKLDKQQWVFSRVVAELDDTLYMAHVDEIGYKRLVRGEQSRPNQLFQTRDGHLFIDTNSPTTALDYLRRFLTWH